MPAPVARPDPGSGRTPERVLDESAIHVNDTVEIRRELAHVFEFVSDGERLPAWVAGVRRAKRVSGPGPIGVGTAYRVVGKLLGRSVESRYELLAYQPPESFTSRMESRYFCLEQTYRFEDADGLTRVTLSGRGVPLGRFKLLGPVLFVGMQRQAKADHRKLKSVLERSRTRKRPPTGG